MTRTTAYLRTALLLASLAAPLYLLLNLIGRLPS